MTSAAAALSLAVSWCSPEPHAATGSSLSLVHIFLLTCTCLQLPNVEPKIQQTCSSEGDSYAQSQNRSWWRRTVTVTVVLSGSVVQWRGALVFLLLCGIIFHCFLQQQSQTLGCDHMLINILFRFTLYLKYKCLILVLV